MNFKGTVSVEGDTGDPLPVVCEVTDTRLVVTAQDGSVIGNWRIDELSVAQTDNEVVVQIDGETLTLAVQDSEFLASALRTTTASGAGQPTSGVKETPADSGQLKHAPQSQQNWHGVKRCTTGAKVPKRSRVMGNACPFCGNTLGATVGSPTQKNATTAEKLSRLDELRSDGLLTAEEYSSRREKLLDDAMETRPPSRSENPSSEAVRRSSGWSRKTVLIVAVVALVIVGVLWWDYSTPSNSPKPGPFTIELLNYRAENPASLVVRYDVTNEGSAPGTFSCRISARDPSYAYPGSVTFETNDPVGAGSTVRVNAHLIITGEGAGYVTHVETSGCK
jgi:hypothetical protein